MAYGIPRYITYQDILAITQDKIQYDLVGSLPVPDTIVEGTDGSITIYWDAMPDNFYYLLPEATTSYITQSTNASGYYGGLSDTDFGIIITGVRGTFLSATDLGEDLVLTGDPNYVTLSLLNDTIAQAESKVEVDLNAVYTVPFVTSDGSPFDLLPQATQDYLRNLFISKAGERILRRFLGKSNASQNASDYAESLMIIYANDRDRLLTRSRTGNLLTYPLDDLQVNSAMLQYPGVPTPKVYTDNVTSVGYAKSRGNNPALNPFIGVYNPRRFRP